MADATKSGANPCGLYLVLPDHWMEPDFLKHARDLFRAINASPYEKNSHIIELRPVEAPYTHDQVEIIAAFCALAKSQGIVFLVKDDIDLAQACSADGVILSKGRDISEARSLIGDDAILGLRCGSSREKAQAAMNLNVDYVSFYDDTARLVDPGLITWWHSLTEKPCLVEGRMTDDDCVFYVKAGADFIDSSHFVWTNPKGVMQGVVDMAYAIETTLTNSYMKDVIQ